MQNASIGMTKEAYFEMCEAIGSEPEESEVPVEYGDFPEEIQLGLNIYRILRDDWEFVGGNYLGKNFNGIFELLEVYEVAKQDRKFYLELLHTIDSVRIEEIRNNKPANKPAK